MRDVDPTELPCAVKAPGLESRRQYWVRDISKATISDLVAVLSAADREADYFHMSSSKQSATESSKPTAIILCAGSAMPNLKEVIFDEFDTIHASFPEVMIICVTDDEDPGFIKSCYDNGLMQVLPASLTVYVTVVILQLIATGGTFVPSQLLI